MALGVAGTSDFHDELRYTDEETRTRLESKIISDDSCLELTKVSTALLLGGLAGLSLTEKKVRQR